MRQRISAVVRTEFRIMFREAWPAVVVLMPLVVLAFLRPLLRLAMRHQGYVGASGSEQGVAGLGVMFAFFVVGIVGYSFFREHGWRTWTRLRAVPVPLHELVIGKAIPGCTLVVVQLVCLTLAGRLFFGLRVHANPVAPLLVMVSLAVALASLGVALVAVCRSFQQMGTITNLGVLVLGGLGGSIAPVELLPGWAQVLARVTPTYWGIRGLRSTFLDGSLATAATSALALFGFAAVFMTFGVRRLRYEVEKVSWL